MSDGLLQQIEVLQSEVTRVEGNNGALLESNKMKSEHIRVLQGEIKRLKDRIKRLKAELEILQ